MYGGVNSRRGHVVTSARVGYAGVGGVLQQGSVQHRWGPRMNRVLNTQVIAGIEALITHAATQTHTAAGVTDPTLYKVRPASRVPGLQEKPLPSPGARMSLHDRMMFGLDEAEGTVVVSQSDALAAWSRPFERRGAEEAPSQDPWRDVIADLHVMKRVAEARQAKCAVGGIC